MEIEDIRTQQDLLEFEAQSKAEYEAKASFVNRVAEQAKNDAWWRHQARLKEAYAAYRKHTARRGRIKWHR